jgi:hypothetical protein
LWLDDWFAIVGMMVVDMGRTLDISDVVQHVCGERVWRRTGNRVRGLLLCGYIIKLPRRYVLVCSYPLSIRKFSFAPSKHVM